MNQSLTDFVYQALERGIPRKEIAAALQQGGWDSKEISAALDGFVDAGLAVPVPRKRVSSSPKDAFLFLMLFSALYTAAFALGSVLFDLVNLFLPLPGETRMDWVISLRYGIASTVVSFPVFLLMSALISRDSLRNPGQRISPVRRWLTYLTLFVASVSIVTDLIALILRFLEGDITLRFGLKVLVAGALAGTAFWYYLHDLHRDEVAPSAEVRTGRSTRFAWSAVVVFVAAVLGVGVWQAGAPSQARLRAQDHQRVQDMQDIAARVQRHYTNTGNLPASLDACDGNPNTYVNHKVDRVTGRPYGYRVLDNTHFEVAAEFATATPADDMQRDGFWKHNPGRKTFTIDATRRRPEE